MTRLVDGGVRRGRRRRKGGGGVGGRGEREREGGGWRRKKKEGWITSGKETVVGARERERGWRLGMVGSGAAEE